MLLTSFRDHHARAISWLASFGLCLGACSPSIDAAAKSNVDRQLAALHASAATLPAPILPRPMELAVGQWSRYKLVDEKGRPSLMTLKVVGQDGSAFWYENKIESYFGTTTTRMLIGFEDRSDPDSIDIHTATIRHNGNVTQYPPAMIGLVHSMLRGALGPIALDWNDKPQEDASVSAGTFEGCYRSTSTVSWGPWTTKSEVWGHPAVPLAGLVKGHRVDKPRVTIELIAFGTSGATSDF